MKQRTLALFLIIMFVVTLHGQVKASDFYVRYTYSGGGHCTTAGYWFPLTYESYMPKNGLIANTAYLNGSYLVSGSGVIPASSGHYESGSGYSWQPSPWPSTPLGYTYFLDQRYMTQDYVTYTHVNWLIRCNKDGSVSVTITYPAP